ncbi:MAG: hypothetical protein GC159_05215 [Phycisphaera sp.]|nr:hypothetical protein [Phycisphaera sp.]
MFGIDPINKHVTEALNAMKMQLAVGVSLEKSLRTSAQGISAAGPRGIMEKAADMSAEGASFQEVLKQLSPMLSYSERTILEAGWEGGRAEWAFESVVERRRVLHETRRQIRGQMVFPSLIFTAACFIAPAPALLAPMISGQGDADLTAYLVQALSPLGFALGLIVLYTLVQRRAARSWANLPAGAAPPRATIFDYLLLGIPVIKHVQRWKNLGEFASLGGNLLGAGVSIFAAFDLCAKAVSNGLYRGDITKIKDRVMKGDPIYVALPGGFRWPIEVRAMLEVGYESGKEDEVLDRMGRHARERYLDAVRTAGQWAGRIIYVFVAMFIILQIVKILGQIGAAYSGVIG